VTKEALQNERLIDFPLGVGEGPLWDAQSQSLYFIDILAPALFRLNPKTKAIQRWDMPSKIGSFGLCPDGRAVVALVDGVYYFDFATQKLDFLVNPEPGVAGNRLNDGKIGPDGYFWIGSMDDRPEKEPRAGLYRVGPDKSCTKLLSGLLVSNGLAWSPDGRRMFHSDSRHRFIQTFDFDPKTGAATNKRVIRTMTEEEGRPDGAACDAEGFYWSAGVSAGVLNRIAPDGTIVSRIPVPLAAPTMPCFGGPDLKTLYVTSLSSDRLGPKEGGTLISFRVDVPGAPIARFGEPLKF